MVIAGPAEAQQNLVPLSQLLSANRHSIEVAGGRLAGDGATLLSHALEPAKYIAVGEDHATREIPGFVAALCSLVPPRELSMLVLETGPEATARVEPLLRSADRIRRMSELDRHFPAFVAFLDLHADNDMAAHCAAASRDPAFRVRGLDQEFVGSTGLLLDMILREPLSSRAAAAVRSLRALDTLDRQEAIATGDDANLLMMRITDEQLDAVERALAHGGSPRARHLFRAMRTSAEIYRKNRTMAPDSNLVRALLMKRGFDAIPRPTGKTILKFGDWHLYKGVNPLGERDLGNHIAEAAEGRGESSLHIIVLGAKGVHAYPAKFGQPLAHQSFRIEEDRDYHWLKTALDLQLSSGWTLFDLRELRHSTAASLDRDWQRVIDGYDLMIIVPELTPTTTIGNE